MRRLALCILLLAPLAHAGESQPYVAVPKPAQELWMTCRVTIARPDRPPGSTDIVVYSSVTPRRQNGEADVGQAFAAFVEKTYGVRGGLHCATSQSEADAEKYLDYMTTNTANPSQITVVRTGWTIQAPDD